MPARVLALDGEEGAGADVQRHEMPGDAARVEGREQALGEVQAGGGRRHGTLAAGIDGLVALGVPGLDCAPAGDIGRQRRIADGRDRLVEIGAGEAERQLHLAAFADPRHRRVEGAQQAHAAVVTEADAVALGKALGRAREGEPAMVVEPLVQIERDDGAVRAAQALALERRADRRGYR